MLRQRRPDRLAIWRATSSRCRAGERRWVRARSCQGHKRAPAYVRWALRSFAPLYSESAGAPAFRKKDRLS